MDKAKEEELDKKFENTALLDKPMNKVFDWSKDDKAVRIALWDYYMGKNDHDTMKTADDMAPYLDMKDDEVKSKAESLLKK